MMGQQLLAAIVIMTLTLLEYGNIVHLHSSQLVEFERKSQLQMGRRKRQWAS